MAIDSSNTTNDILSAILRQLTRQTSAIEALATELQTKAKRQADAQFASGTGRSTPRKPTAKDEEKEKPDETKPPTSKLRRAVIDADQPKQDRKPQTKTQIELNRLLRVREREAAEHPGKPPNPKLDQAIRIKEADVLLEQKQQRRKAADAVGAPDRAAQRAAPQGNLNDSARVLSQIASILSSHTQLLARAAEKSEEGVVS